MTSEPQCGDQSAGFMIIEVVIALAIVALGVGLAYQSLSGAMDRLGRNHNSTEALLFAQSTLDRVGYDIPPKPGELSGKTKEGFAWVVKTSPYMSAAVPTGGSLTGYLVQVISAAAVLGEIRVIRGRLL